MPQFIFVTLKTNRISTAGASIITTRLASRTVTGHELPIHVHQHYALEFHFVLNPNTKTCMRRRFLNARDTHDLCFLLIRSAFSGLCSCLFDGRGDLIDAVEQCFRAEPIEITTYDFDLCEEELEDARWMAKIIQKNRKQTSVLVDRLTIIVRRCMSSFSELCNVGICDKTF